MKIEIESKHLSAFGAYVYAMQDEVNAKNFSDLVNNMFNTFVGKTECDYSGCNTCSHQSQCDIFYYLLLGIHYIDNGGPEDLPLRYLRGEEITW